MGNLIAIIILGTILEIFSIIRLVRSVRRLFKGRREENGKSI